MRFIFCMLVAIQILIIIALVYFNLSVIEPIFICK